MTSFQTTAQLWQAQFSNESECVLPDIGIELAIKFMNRTTIYDFDSITQSLDRVGQTQIQ